eukprot:375586_1
MYTYSNLIINNEKHLFLNNELVIVYNPVYIVLMFTDLELELFHTYHTDIINTMNTFFEEVTHGKCSQCQDNVKRYGTHINHFALRLLLKLRILCPFSAAQCHDEKQIDMYQCGWIGCYC